MQAAEYAHNMVQAEKASAAGGTLRKVLSAASIHRFFKALCETIIPAEDGTGGASKRARPSSLICCTSEILIINSN